ncbi:MAG: FGGY-family carbohydrate kinase [Spirochaetota bacterium]|nr:MAG: FGGY-family carbohydrate kinase [Spirochaetota bacterium]
MSKKIIACDLGTGGNKASLYDADGTCLESTFVPYDTLYPKTGWHEQRPMDWWSSVVDSIRWLLEKRPSEVKTVECIVFSGHSLGVVPLARDGKLLRDHTPIWSDNRSGEQSKRFFDMIDYSDWYMTTGNGFPPELYSVFKIMWYRDQEPDIFKKIYKIIGTKDFINFMLTGKILTDYSYASGSGVYDLKKWHYAQTFLETAGIPQELLPEIVESTHIVGELTRESADILGLDRKVKVVCGGVDNSCMALGSRNIYEGRVYTSLGSSSWIAVSSKDPILDIQTRPFVFTHVIPEMFTSAVSIFAAGSSLNWVKENMCRDLIDKANASGQDVYDLINESVSLSPIGANKLLFNPSLAGGSSQEPSPHIRGCFSGLDLGHTQNDILRSCMEGIALNLGLAFDVLKKVSKLSEEMLLVGGGSKSKLWRQIFADVYNIPILKTNIGQDAGSLGACAIGAVGTKLWRDFKRIDDIHEIHEINKPIQSNVKKYSILRPVFKELQKSQGIIGNMLHEIEL